MERFNPKDEADIQYWIIKFLEGIEDDFDVVLEGLIAKNTMGLEEYEPYRTTSLIRVHKHNILFCDYDTKITIKSKICKRLMLDAGYTEQFINCFKYGFPTNWVALVEYFYVKMKSGEDVTLPDSLASKAIDEQKYYEKMAFDNAIKLYDWYLELVDHEDNLYIYIRGFIEEEDSEGKSYRKEIIDGLREREQNNLICCKYIPLFRLCTEINLNKMLDLKYPRDFIENFANGIPKDYVELFRDYHERKNSYQDDSKKDDLISQDSVKNLIDEMEQNDDTSFSKDSDNDKCIKNSVQDTDEVAELEGFMTFPSLHKFDNVMLNKTFESKAGTSSPYFNINIDSYLSPSMLTGSFGKKISPSSLKQSFFDDKNTYNDDINDCNEPLMGSTPFMNRCKTSDYKYIDNIVSPIGEGSFGVVSETVFDASQRTPIKEDDTDITPCTDFFAITNDGELSEIRPRRIDKPGKRRINSSPECTPEREKNIFTSKTKVMKKRRSYGKNVNDDFIERICRPIDINNSHDLRELFNESLGLSDISQSALKRFNINDESFVDSFEPLDFRLENKKAPVYYLPTGRNIVGGKQMNSKKAKKIEPVKQEFDFQALVYNDIEERRAKECEDHESSISD
uniref:SANTA domain-containing protein n=1 Tax=Parastrongyloides trichosuri TaxID=131310 RepID=A0A0N4ZPX0_PARTI